MLWRIGSGRLEGTEESLLRLPPLGFLMLLAVSVKLVHAF